MSGGRHAASDAFVALRVPLGIVPPTVLPAVFPFDFLCVLTPPSPSIQPPSLGSSHRLRYLVRQGMCNRVLHRQHKVPQEALLWHPRQEGATVLALAPSHAIRALALGVPVLTVPSGKAER